MKRLVTGIMACGGLLTCVIALHAQPAAQNPKQPQAQNQPQNAPQMTQEATKDIKAMFGFVPGFLKAVPDEATSAVFDEMRTLGMGTETALPVKTKHLICLGVSAQIPCQHCVYADTQFAKALGASERELKEAVAMAAITRHWSTVLNGNLVDEPAFTKEVNNMFTYIAKNKPAPTNAQITDATSAFKDMEATLGAVPTMFKVFPTVAVAPAWREFKAVQLNPNTALDGKTKELIGLGVSSQIPCHYCVRFHTAAAKFYGATQQELQEAVAMAALTRHMSTIIQGSLQDEAKFRRDIDQIVKATRPKQPRQAVR